MRHKVTTLLVSIMAICGLFALTPTTLQAADSFDLFPSTCEKVGDSKVCGPCKGVSDATVCQDSKDIKNPLYGPDSIVATIVNILSVIIGVAAVIVIIIAGIQYMLSTGDPTKVNNSKNAILYAIVGLIIAGMAQVLVRFILAKIG